MIQLFSPARIADHPDSHLLSLVLYMYNVVWAGSSPSLLTNSLTLVKFPGA